MPDDDSLDEDYDLVRILEEKALVNILINEIIITILKHFCYRTKICIVRIQLLVKFMPISRKNIRLTFLLTVRKSDFCIVNSNLTDKCSFTRS